MRGGGEGGQGEGRREGGGGGSKVRGGVWRQKDGKELT